MELRPIDQTDRGRSRLNTALGIYRDTILAEARNPERQIIYWIDHSKDALSDEFRCFAIQDGSSIVGYFQYSYFREEHLFFLEYLCIRGSRQKGLVPSKAVKVIEDFLAQNYLPNFTIVFEVAKKRKGSRPWESDEKLLAYFTRLGFRKVDFNYHYPILQSYEGEESSYPADLMVRLPDGRTEVSSFEMRTILRCIYFKHYLRWDRPFLDPQQLAKRERLINELYSREVSRLSGDGTFGTTGDDKRTLLARFTDRQPKIRNLLAKIFGPKMPRIIAIMIMLLGAQWLLGNGLLLVPFVLAVAAIYCLAEDTTASKKLLTVIIARLSLVRPRPS